MQKCMGTLFLDLGQNTIGFLDSETLIGLEQCDQMDKLFD